MACGLFGVKPLSEPMLPYCQLGLEERISVRVVKILKFSLKETSLKISSTKWRPLCLGLNVFIQLDQLIWPSITRGRRYCHYSEVALVSWRPNHCGATVCSIICSGKQLRNVISTTIYEGNPLLTGGFPKQRVSDAESVWVCLSWRCRGRSFYRGTHLYLDLYSTKICL